MAVFERQDPYKNQLTKGLASGLSGILEDLASSKMKEIDRQRTAQGLESVGFGKQEAEGISKLSPELQKTILTTGAQQKQLAAKEKIAAQKEQTKAQQLAAKESEKYVSDIASQQKAAQESDKRLNRMEYLVKKGSLPVSHLYRLFTNLSEADIGKNAPVVGPLAGLFINPIVNAIGGAGLGIQRQITSKDTEEYEKLQAEFLRDIKNVFGARISNLEVENFLKLIPTLANTDSGKLKIIENLKSANKAVELRDKAMRQIIKENKGIRPPNLQLMVEERIKPQLDTLSRQFVESSSLGLL